MRSPAGNIEAHVRRELLTQEPHLLPQLYMHARNAWLLPGHPGWGVFKFQGAACSDVPLVLSEAEPATQHSIFTYACEPSLIACFTPASNEEPPQHAHAPTEAPGPVAGITSSEMNARGVSGDIFSMSSPEKAPEHHDLFHLSTDPLAPVAPNTARDTHPQQDVQMHAPHAFVGENRATRSAAGMDVGASVFDSVSLKGLSGVTNLSSLFASAVSLPPDENNNSNKSSPTPPVINWMATTSNAMNMGVPVNVNPVNVFPQMHAHAAHAPAPVIDTTAGNSCAGNTAFANVAPVGGTVEEGGLSLRRPRSNTLGSSMLDVARSDRQRLRADTDACQAHAGQPADCNECVTCPI